MHRAQERERRGRRQEDFWSRCPEALAGLGAPQQVFSQGENRKCYTLALLAANAFHRKRREKMEASFAQHPCQMEYNRQQRTFHYNFGTIHNNGIAHLTCFCYSIIIAW